MIDNFGYILFGIVVGGIIAYLLMRSGRGAEFTSKLGSFKIAGEPDKVGTAQLDAAFERITDVAQGVVAIFDASPEDVDATAREWFDYLASCLSGALRTQPEELYRVAIWEDTGLPDQFVGIGWAMFDANDPAVERLGKNDTLAGIAFRSVDRVLLARRHQ